MNKKLLTAAFFVGAWGAYSQVGIGTLTPNPSTQLDIVSENKGVLFPRVNLISTTDATTITQGNVSSLFVYNTGNNNDIKPGYYYWYENKWMRIVNDADVVALDKNTTNQSLTVIGAELVLTDSDGNTVSVPLSAINIPTSIVKNPDGTYTFTNEAGATVTIDATDNVVTNIQNQGDIYSEIINILTQESDLFVDNGNGTFTHTAVDGTVVTFDANTTAMVDNGDGTYTFTNANGTTLTVDVVGDVVTNIQNQGAIYSEIINILEQESDIFTDNGNGTFTHTAVDGTVVTFDANTTAMLDNGNGTYTFTNANGTTLTVDVVGGVVNNFEEIVNNGPITVDGNTYPTINDYITYLTESTGGFTKIVYDATTGDAIFQEWNDATQQWVNVDNSKFEKIVQDNESKTSLVQTTNEKNQYYIAEEYLSNRTNPAVTQSVIDGWNPTSLPAGVYQVDVVGGVVNNFEEIVNNGPITVDGNTYPTINDYITYLTESTGGFTKIVYDATTGDAIFQEWNDTTQQWVNVDNSKFEKIVQDNESKTSLVQTTNEKNQYYIGEEYLSNRSNPAVTQSVIDGWNPTSLPAGVYQVDVVGGVVNNFEEIVNNGPITVNGNTYPTINDYITYLTESTGGFTKIVYDATTGDAIFQEWNDATQQWVNVDNSKFEKIVQDNETVTLLVTNPNGSFTYYNEDQIGADGNPLAGATGVTIDPNKVNVSYSNGIYTFNNADGTPITTIDVNSDKILYDNSTSGLTSNNVKDALDELANTIALTKGDLAVSEGIEFYNSNGTDKLLGDAHIRIIDGGVTTAKLADNAVTEDKIADKAVSPEKLSADPADIGKVGVVQADGTVVYQNLDAENIDGKDLTAADGSIVVTDGTGATLVDANVKVADGGITTVKLGADAVTNDKLADNAVSTENIVDGTVATADLADNAVTEDKIADKAVSPVQFLQRTSLTELLQLLI